MASKKKGKKKDKKSVRKKTKGAGIPIAPDVSFHGPVVSLTDFGVQKAIREAKEAIADAKRAGVDTTEASRSLKALQRLSRGKQRIGPKKKVAKKTAKKRGPMFRMLSEFEAHRFRKEFDERLQDPNFEVLSVRKYVPDGKGGFRREYTPEEQAERDAKKKARNERARFARRKKKAEASPKTETPTREITAAEVFDITKFRRKKD